MESRFEVELEEDGGVSTRQNSGLWRAGLRFELEEDGGVSTRQTSGLWTMFTGCDNA